MSLANILVVEDDPTIAIDIRFNLEDNNYTVVNVLHAAEQAVQLLDKVNVDLILLDINLDGEMTGIELAEIVNQKFQVPFIFLTSYSDKSTLEKASHTFPAGYIVKPFKENDLAPAIQMALARHSAESTIASFAMINKKLVHKITNSEYDIIHLIWQGKSNLEIAEQKFISKNTLKSHIRNIYSKLNVHSKPELISWLRTLRS